MQAEISGFQKFQKICGCHYALDEVLELYCIHEKQIRIDGGMTSDFTSFQQYTSDIRTMHGG